MADRRKKENLKTELLDADFKDLMDMENSQPLLPAVCVAGINTY
jgi:hypothetical protein